MAGESGELLNSVGGVLPSARVVSEPSGHLGGTTTLKGGQDWIWGLSGCKGR